MATPESTEALADDALFRPLRGNAFEETVARLLQTIQLGVVEPGDALPPERELAARFSVSRDTLRDAIRSLSDAGYLTARRGRYGGTFISEPLPAPSHSAGGAAIDPAELDDALGLREILEVGAVRAVARRELAAAERERLWARCEEAAAAAAPDYRRLDSRLHLTIGELAGTPSLMPLLADNRTRVNGLLDAIPLLGRNIAHSNEQHRAIVTAILTGNEEAAATAMAEHLAGSAALLRAFLA